MGKPHWNPYGYVDPAIFYGPGLDSRPELSSGPLLFVIHRELKLASPNEARHLAESLKSTTTFDEVIPEFLRGRTPENTGDESSPGDITGLSQLADLIESGALHHNSDWRFDVFPTPGAGDAGYYLEIRLILDTEQAFRSGLVPSGVFPHHLLQSDGQLTVRYVEALKVLVARYPTYQAFLRSVFALGPTGGSAS